MRGGQGRNPALISLQPRNISKIYMVLRRIRGKKSTFVKLLGRKKIDHPEIGQHLQNGQRGESNVEMSVLALEKKKVKGSCMRWVKRDAYPQKSPSSPGKMNIMFTASKETM